MSLIACACKYASSVRMGGGGGGMGGPTTGGIGIDGFCNQIVLYVMLLL